MYENALHYIHPVPISFYRKYREYNGSDRPGNPQPENPAIRKKETVYNLLSEVSEQANYLFIYDSNIISNDKKIRVKKGYYSIRQAIHAITGNEQLALKIVGSHILIYPEEKNKRAAGIFQRNCNSSRHFFHHTGYSPGSLYGTTDPFWYRRSP
ncbi:MAG: STN domain-containing protein [Tannerellaceae bacterium]|nr:STN domain-containing protein [Tannerellaceae bacterium]